MSKDYLAYVLAKTLLDGGYLNSDNYTNDPEQQYYDVAEILQKKLHEVNIVEGKEYKEKRVRIFD